MKNVLKLLAALTLFAVIATVIVSCGNTEVSETSAETKPVTEKAETENTEETQTPENEIKKTDYSKYFTYKEFELPTDFRQAAIDYMLEAANVVWYCGQDFSTSENFEAQGWGISLDYKKGEEYHGLPYANSYSTVEEFERYLDPQRRFNTSPDKWLGKAWQSIPGLECASSVITSLAHFADIHGYSVAFCPFEKSFQAIPLGDYTYNEEMTSTHDITNANKPAKMNECYSLLQMGDVIMHMNEKRAAHVRMIHDNHVEKKSDGSIVGRKSYVTTIEQTNKFDAQRKDGVKTTWYVDHTYTYEDLFSDGYVPSTIKEYTEGNTIPMYIGLTREINADDLAEGAFVGSVETNSYFRFLLFEIFNKDGSIAARYAKHNTLDYDNSQPGTSSQKMDFRKYAPRLFEDLPGGEYTFVLTAGIPAGEAELARVDFTYAK